MKTNIRARAIPIVTAFTVVACATTRDPGVSASQQPAPTTSRVSTQAQDTPTVISESAPGTIPTGQEFDVRLRTGLSSETATVEQRFETTTVADLTQNGRVLVPAGSLVSGVVSAVDKAGRVDRSGSLTLTFDRIEVNGRERDIRASAAQVYESRGIREDVPRAGVGAGVGGIIGGIIGGVKGAVLGAVIGAGGAIAATDGEDIDLPAGSIIRIRLDSPVRVS
jgi:hypothetical protein